MMTISSFEKEMTKVYTYTLECGHTVTSTVADNDTMSTYKVTQKVICPKDHYAYKKIIKQVIT